MALVQNYGLPSGLLPRLFPYAGLESIACVKTLGVVRVDDASIHGVVVLAIESLDGGAGGHDDAKERGDAGDESEEGETF